MSIDLATWHVFQDEMIKISRSAYGNPGRAAWNEAYNRTQKEQRERDDTPKWRFLKRERLRKALVKKRREISNAVLPGKRKIWADHLASRRSA